MLRNLGIVMLPTILGGFMGWRLGWLSVTGRLDRWQLLNAPPADAVEIFGGEPDLLLVRTEQGQVYQYIHHSWQEIILPSDFIPREDFDCYASVTPKPPGSQIDSFSESTWCLETAHRRYYVLLDDHSVWRWEYSTPDAVMGTFMEFLWAICGLITGLIGSMVFLFIASVWRRTINTRSEGYHEKFITTKPTS